MTATSFARDERLGTTRAAARQLTLVGIAMLAAAVAPLGAQNVRIAPGVPLIGIGTEAEERARLSQIVTRGSVSGSVIRSLSRSDTAKGIDSTQEYEVSPVPFDYRAVYNSGLPYSLNDGPMWAG